MELEGSPLRTGLHEGDGAGAGLQPTEPQGSTIDGQLSQSCDAMRWDARGFGSHGEVRRPRVVPPISAPEGAKQSGNAHVGLLLPLYSAAVPLDPGVFTD